MNLIVSYKYRHPPPQHFLSGKDWSGVKTQRKGLVYLSSLASIDIEGEIALPEIAGINIEVENFNMSSTFWEECLFYKIITVIWY